MREIDRLKRTAEGKQKLRSFGARNWIFEDVTVSQRKKTTFLEFVKSNTEKDRENISVITFTPSCAIR